MEQDKHLFSSSVNLGQRWNDTKSKKLFENYITKMDKGKGRDNAFHKPYKENDIKKRFIDLILIEYVYLIIFINQF